MESNQVKHQKEYYKNEDRLRNLFNIIKPNNMRIRGVPDGEERDKGTENLFKEIIAENSLIWRNSNLGPRSRENPKQDESKGR